MAAISAAISSLGLALLIAQLIDVFVRHLWRGSGPDAPMALSLGGATVGLGAAVIGLCIVTTFLEAVVLRQCPM